MGGLPLQAQAVDLQRRPDIVVCTPGRMIDHVHNSMSVDLDDVEVVILDEADRLLELGFTEELHELLRLCPVKRQTLLFSATMTDDVSDLISLSLQKPVRVFVDPVNQVVDRLVQVGGPAGESWIGVHPREGRVAPHGDAALDHHASLQDRDDHLRRAEGRGASSPHHSRPPGPQIRGAPRKPQPDAASPRAGSLLEEGSGLFDRDGRRSARIGHQSRGLDVDSGVGRADGHQSAHAEGGGDVYSPRGSYGACWTRGTRGDVRGGGSALADEEAGEASRGGQAAD